MEGVWLVSYIALWLLLLALGVLMVSLLRNVGLLATAVQQLQSGVEDTLTLQVGESVPELPLTTLSGQATSLAAQRGAPIVLVFVSPGCGPCHALLKALRRGYAAMPELPQATRQILVSLGDEAATRALLVDEPFHAGPVLLADPAVLEERWGLRATPTTILLDAKGQYLRHQIGSTPSRTGYKAPATHENTHLHQV